MPAIDNEQTYEQVHMQGHKQVHVLVITMGSAGDLFPFLRVALELQRLGRRVTVLAPLMHAPYVQTAGLAFHGLPADPAVLADPDLWHPQRGFAVIWRALRPGVAELRRYLQALPPGEPCLMLAHPLVLPEAAAWRALRPGLKIVGMYLAPSNIQTVHDPLTMGPVLIPHWVPLRVRAWLWKLAGKVVLDPVALPGINAARQALGVAPATSLLGAMKDAPDLSVALFPAWFGAPQPDWPHPFCMGDFALYDPQGELALPPQLAAFLQAGTAPLVFTHGTGNQQADAYFARALVAAQVLGRRVILLTPHRAQVPAALPSTALWLDYIPLRSLLPHVAALVHHGGIGTTAEALRAGVPQLIVALAYDQFDNGERVRRLQAGLALRAARLSTRRLVAALATLLASSTIQQACLQIKGRFASATTMDAVLASISKLISETGKN